MSSEVVMDERVSLGDLIKSMEAEYEQKLDKTVPAIIRLDGKGFSKLTKRLKNSFDPFFETAMVSTTQFLCENIQDVVAAYTQSDEITLVLIPKKQENKPEPDAWFDFRVQKMVSTAASMCAVEFYKTCNTISLFGENAEFEIAFDARVFSCPPENVIKTLMWRQQDCQKNSISKFADRSYSHKQLQGKNGREKIEMCLEKDHSWEKELSFSFKYGNFFHKEVIEKQRDTGEVYTRGVWVKNKHEKLFKDEKELFSSLIFK